MSSPTAKRRARILGDYDVRDRDGLEIGPLDKPLITRRESSVRYVDQFSTDELRAKFAADPNVRVADICDVDFVLRGKQLGEAVTGTFDYLLASHVFEHVPNPVQWLCDVEKLLAPDGRLMIVVPDRRYTFDALRPATSVGEMLEAFYTGRRRPAFKNVFDQGYYWREVNAHHVWAGREDPRTLPPHCDPRGVLDNAVEALRAETYVDCHCNVLTGDECVEFAKFAFEHGLTRMKVVRYVPCEHNDNEFVVHLSPGR